MAKRIKKKVPTGKIVISFDDRGRVHFDIKTGMNSQLIVALMGLEGFLHSVTGLDATAIREMIDEEKHQVSVSVNPAEDVIDVEEE